MEQTIVIRIRLQDWFKLRRHIRAYPNESAANYIKRIANRLEDLK